MKMNPLAGFVFLLFTCTAVGAAHVGNNGNRKNNPLLGDEGRKHLRSTECHFGKSIKELGSTWFADLGPPFGVMYCIKCECVPFQKKRRIVARVQCRNIKHECPKPTCDEPVLYPGRCCKTCPGDLYVPDLVQDFPAQEEDKNMKYFGALLTGRTSLVFKRDDIVNIPSTSKNPTYQIIATGRFTFHKKNLFYSFYLTNSLNQMPPRPRTIQFINHKGDLLQEQSLSTMQSVYQNATTKICGVWRRVPREYKRLLRDETLYVALLWGNDLALSGQIARFRALNTEQFSALLTPTYSELIEPDSGGTAIVTTMASPSTIHISLVFNGVFTPDQVSDVPVVVRLENLEKGQTLFEEIIRIQKPSHNLNFGEISSLISISELRPITRGKLVITVASKTKPDMLLLSGPVVARTACEIFQTPLAPSTELDGPEAQETTLVAAPTTSSGMAWMYVNRDGSVTYNIQMDEMQDTPTFSLMSSVKGRKAVEVQQFIPSHMAEGWATGALDKLSLKQLELLYAGELSINIAAPRSTSVIRGQLTSRPVAGAVDSHSAVLLKRLDSRKTADLIGMAWMTIDFDCDLHYEVQLSGTGAENQRYQLHLEDTPVLAPNAPISKRLLEDFNGTFLEGFSQLTPQELSRMDSGICFFEITDFTSGAVLLKANMKEVKIPLECLSHTSDNDVSPFLPMSSSHLIPEVTKCYHEGAFYDEGSQWKHARDPCKMCHCLRGKEKCDDVICPALTCPNKFKPSSGECCPTCNNSTTESNASTGCVQAGQFHPAGSSWHPYLPPNGFNLCIIMTCHSDAKTSTIKYTRVQCPPLKCSEKEAIRTDKNSCCKTCPVPEDILAKDQSMPFIVTRKKTDDEILREGGCTYLGRGPYENNTEWPHSIPSIGVTCVKCRCKDGNVQCERKKCSRTQCANNSTTQSNSEVDDCCSYQCRYRRQSRHRQRQRQRHL